jgi:putative tryptophan/tyrosine transport system substrate-binding protein
MRRRDFISSIGGATAAWPLAARGQQPAKTYRIAVVHPSAPVADMSERGGNPNYAALFRELRRLGYTEGVNLIVARYSGEGREERFPEVCQEVVRTKPDVIVASSSRLALSFKAATLTVPIVAIMADPVPSGLVANIARPEGNHGDLSTNQQAKSCRPSRRIGVCGWEDRTPNVASGGTASDGAPAAGRAEVCR